MFGKKLDQQTMPSTVKLLPYVSVGVLGIRANPDMNNWDKNNRFITSIYCLILAGANDDLTRIADFQILNVNNCFGCFG